MGYPYGTLTLVVLRDNITASWMFFVGLIDEEYQVVDQQDLIRLVATKQFKRVRSFNGAYNWISQLQNPVVLSAQAKNFLDIVSVSERGTRFVVGHDNIYRLMPVNAVFIPADFRLRDPENLFTNHVYKPQQLPTFPAFDESH